MPASHNAAANRRGIIFMTLAMASFIVNDCLVKYVSETLPGPQLIFIRGVFSSMLLLLAAHLTGALRAAFTGGTASRGAWMERKVLLRSAMDALSTMVYLTSLFHLPIGNATAINMATPLVITLCAAVALHERISPGRWMAVVVGFAGVLLVVQPAATGFNAWALLCLSGTLLGAVRDLLTRSIRANVPSVVITLSTAIVTALFAGCVTALHAWHPVGLEQLGLLAIAAVFLSIGYYLLIACLRVGEMSVISPFRYTALLFALLVGWVVWGDVPNGLAWAGIALLVGAGLYMLRSGRTGG